MQGTRRRTIEATTTGDGALEHGTTADGTTTGGVGPERGRDRSRLLAGALALALLAGGVGAALLSGDDADQRRDVVTQDRAGEPDAQPDAQPPAAAPQAPQQPAPQPAAPADVADPEDGSGSAPDAPPAAPAPEAADAVPAGTYGARVLGEGWDERGRYVVVDRGQLSDGPPAEPGVDGTRPVLFDTGAVAERRRIDLADGHDLRFARSGGEPSYGPGGWADLVTEITGRADPLLATIVVDADGRLVSLVEPYRP